MHPLWLALALVFTPAPVVTVAGDSVLVTIALTDNATPQAVSVDSVEFYCEITGMVGGGRTKKVAKVAGTTTATLAYALSIWAPNQTKGGKYGARLGHTESGVTAWSAYTYVTSPGWSYTRTVAAPDAPETLKVSNPSTSLN